MRRPNAESVARPPRLRRRAALGLLWVAAGTAFGTPATGAGGLDLRRALSEVRGELGRSPLTSAEPLDRLAQGWADQLAEAGSVATHLLPADRIAAAAELGYRARTLFVAVAHADGSAKEVLARWEVADPASYRALLAGPLHDLGVGVARLGDTPLYVLVAAQSVDEYFRPVLGRLREVDALRQRLLELVNERRRTAEVAPLRLNYQLNQAAQDYAREMFVGGFYGHVSPSGANVLDRVRAAGYRGRRAGENLAHGGETVEQVFDGWMRSSRHRENILSPRFRELGLGVAAGPDGDGYKILWVQCFGRRR